MKLDKTILQAPQKAWLHMQHDHDMKLLREITVTDLNATPTWGTAWFVKVGEEMKLWKENYDTSD